MPPPTDQETLFRAVAIKCAEMENTLSSQMKTHIGDRSIVSLGQNTYLRSIGSTIIEFSSVAEGISGTPDGQLEGKPTIVFTDGTSDFVNRLGIETNKRLQIESVYSDEKTREEFDLFAKNNPIKASNAITTFFFNSSGEYKKIVLRPKEMSIIPNRPIFLATNSGNIYESEMTAEDFELAGTALQILLDRLTPQEEKPAE